MSCVTSAPTSSPREDPPDPAPRPRHGSPIRTIDVNFIGASADAKEHRCILIAEDHPDSRDALRALLEAVGYRVATAADGREAVDQARSAQPDLILMDIMMPGVDGLQATRTLREDASFQHVPVLALTAMEGARTRALEAGCDDYVTKPIDISRLFAKIQSWLQAGRAADGPG